jgi:hypothetical protein
MTVGVKAGRDHDAGVAPEVLVQFDLGRVGAGRHVVTAGRRPLELLGCDRHPDRKGCQRGAPAARLPFSKRGVT